MQLKHIYDDGPILDVGFYENIYKVYIIYNNDWDKPKDVFESQKPNLIENKIYDWIDKYASGL